MSVDCPSCGYRLVSHQPLTPRQAALYRWIAEFARLNGYAPSFDEMAAALGVTISTVHEHLGNLERKGYLRRQFNTARGITCIVSVSALGAAVVA